MLDKHHSLELKVESVEVLHNFFVGEGTHVIDLEAVLISNSEDGCGLVEGARLLRLLGGHWLRLLAGRRSDSSERDLTERVALSGKEVESDRSPRVRIKMLVLVR